MLSESKVNNIADKISKALSDKEFADLVEAIDTDYLLSTRLSEIDMERNPRLYKEEK